MTIYRITVQNKLGLHTRAAADLVKLAGKFDSELKLVYKDRQADAKSIISIMALAAAFGSQVELHADGSDAIAAATAIRALFERRFGEDE